jgi:hypothetical protein
MYGFTETLILLLVLLRTALQTLYSLAYYSTGLHTSYLEGPLICGPRILNNCLVSI